ncbi:MULTISPECIES: hypothetical protein [Trichocoleus]|uniref:Uncharacterized protein n=1 Tax=Trichocoleus desertorum GB2-A4 TaxID=2933944 RepID=A0ABV0JFS2_9CYAN|nr:hypothetical protein [Trichocoleus sp. FACHB-46]MBD1865609.1 hypothetical protein [Trichocoleus sp. FACHB-46]
MLWLSCHPFLFINLELAHVDLTETEALQQGSAIGVAKFDVSAIPERKPWIDLMAY